MTTAKRSNAVPEIPTAGETVAGSVGGSPERFHEFLKREIAKWQNVVKLAGIQSGS